MQIVLMTLVGAGLLGCFAATLSVNLTGRSDGGRRLSRPRSTALGRDL